jgi:hypothetical protein
MKIDVLSEKIIIKLANILENKQNVKFEYNDLFYEIFESCDSGYIINLYSSNEKDEDGEYLEENNVDGGLCNGAVRDAILFML